MFGDVHASKTVVLFGDSHAEQWQPAFAEAGRREHWRVVSWTKVACPVAQVNVTNAQLKRTYTECLTWRAQTIARILALKPSLVMMGQSDAVFGTAQSQYFSNPDIAKQTIATMNIFRSAGITVNYLLDSPYPAQNVPDCVAGHLSDIHYCGRGNYQTYLTARRAAMQQGLGRAGYSTIDSAPWICSTRFCPAVVGNLLVYRDETHLSASYSRWLAPLVQPLLRSGRATPAPAHTGLAGAQH